MTDSSVHRQQRAFTLVELLVVIGIIVVLIALLVPALSGAKKAAIRAAQSNDLQAIALAIEAFKADYGYYPPVAGPAAPDAKNKGLEGAIALCQALLGPTDADDLDDDDKDGDLRTVYANEKKDFGARIRPGGKLYGPYLPPERFKLEVVDTTLVEPKEKESTSVLIGRDDQPILYFPVATTKPNVRVSGADIPKPYVGDKDVSRYDYRDNLGPTGGHGPFTRTSEAALTPAIQRIQIMIGDTNFDGVLSTGETEVDKPFLLWSAGPDGVFGPNADSAGDLAVLDLPDVMKCDDVTNFR